MARAVACVSGKELMQHLVALCRNFDVQPFCSARRKQACRSGCSYSDSGVASFSDTVHTSQQIRLQEGRKLDSPQHSNSAIPLLCYTSRNLGHSRYDGHTIWCCLDLPQHTCTLKDEVILLTCCHDPRKCTRRGLVTSSASVAHLF
jgi:hypothetical protein